MKGWERASLRSHSSKISQDNFPGDPVIVTLDAQRTKKMKACDEKVGIEVLK